LLTKRCAAGRVTAAVGERVPLEKAPSASAQMAAGAALGKIVVIIWIPDLRRCSAA
jgi:NADPH:quinone reductase-like Zn-dependent oxidoreductase